jgi:hypothetical protein
MAAAANTFRAALGRIGFNAQTQDAMNENGFMTILDLTTVEEDDLDRLPKHLESWRDPDDDPADQVRVPFVSLKRLKAMRYWVLSQRWIGIEPVAAQFTNAVLEETLLRMQSDKDYKAATEDTEVTKPEKFSDMQKWMKFYELFITYLGRVKGAANIPLTYLVREKGEVTQEIRDAEYETMDDRLIATTVHSGPHFAIDNKTLYDELKPLVMDGPGWSFIKQFDKAKDGRKAFLALKSQAEGQAAKLNRKTKAYAQIEQSVYRGPRRGFTFDSYVSLHQEAHNELLDLGEPVSESKKVTSFLRGVQDPKLDSGKVNVYGDAAKLDDFQATQQYLKTLVQTMTEQTKMERNVSSATRGGGGGKSLVDKIKGGSYSKEQFESLTKEEKERVAQYREEAQKKKNAKARDRAKKRKLAKAQSERNDDANTGDGEDEPAGANAGAQFGSNGNKSKKKSK